MKRLISAKAILALLLVAFLLSQPVSAYALQKEGSDYTVVDRREYPIIFIPGMAGSTLDTADGVNAWPGSLSLSDEAFKALALKDDGQNPLPPDGKRLLPTGTVRTGLGDVYSVAGPIAKVVVSAVPGIGPVLGSYMPITGDYRPAFAWVYKGFYDYMEGEGYRFDQTPSVLNQNPSGKVFFDFPYDFRQDNNLWTKALDKKVNLVRSQTRADKVILVGHSMGGLQARLYMKDPNRAKKVAAVVFMGTPHHGAPMAFYSFTEGYNFGNAKLSNARMWEIAGNWEGGYQLMPDYDFILDEKLMKLLGGVEWINTKDWISGQEYDHYMTAETIRFTLGEKAAKPYKVRYGFPNSDFASKSIAFHQKLGDSLDKYPWVKYYGIRGTGQETAALLMARFQDLGLPKPVLRFEKLGSTEGDGTVPFKGAHVDGLDKDKEFEVVESHGAIPSNAKAQQILTNIRKEINNENFRKDLVDKMSGFAKVKLAELRITPRFSGYTPSMFTLLKDAVLWLIQPDKEKIKLRDEIRGMALAEMKNARANITIATLEGALEKDKLEHLYLVIDDLEVTDAGTGVIDAPTVNVTVDSYRTFNQVVTKQMDLMAAYTSGAMKVEGTGFSDTLQLKLAQWIIKYFMK